MTGNLLPHGDRWPEVADSAFIAPGAYVVGDVYLGDRASVWYGAVLRGDTERIYVGARSSHRRCLKGRAPPTRSRSTKMDCLVVKNDTIFCRCGVSYWSVGSSG